VKQRRISLLPQGFSCFMPTAAEMKQQVAVKQPEPVQRRERSKPVKQPKRVKR
jgi:hypothetical protein